MKVLVTGALGWTGVAIIEALHQAGHGIIAFDLPSAVVSPAVRPLLDKVVSGDIADYKSVDLAFQEADAIVHLAVAIGENAYQAPDIPFAVNVKGTYNIFESAREHKVQRIVLMSSASVHLHHPATRSLRAASDWYSDAGPDHLYDLTKRLQEEIARDFCRTHNMNAVILRAGHIVDGRTELDPEGKPLAEIQYCRGGWVCRYDLATACVKALAISSHGYQAFHIIGARKAELNFDIPETVQSLGLTFQSRFEAYE